jgi:hypothetical protein
MMHAANIGRSRAFALAAGALLLPLLAPVRAHAREASFSTYASSDDLQKNVYHRIRHILGKELPSGAMGVNAKFEQGQADGWYIEGQRYGGDLIQAGVAQNDRKMIDDGIRALDWGFQKEASDGSFPGTGDPFHSTSLFLEAAARGLLLLRDYDSSGYRDVLDRDTPKVKATARWITSPDVQEDGRRKNQPYTHRRWILASALAESAELTGDKHFLRAAREYAEDGISLQRGDGVDPEKGGSDSSYQAYGLLQAERYLLADKDSPLRDQVAGVIRHGLDWEVSRISTDGDVDTAGNTRTGIEKAHIGKTKTVDYSALQQALVVGAAITGNSEYRDSANSVASAQERKDREKERARKDDGF